MSLKNIKIIVVLIFYKIICTVFAEVGEDMSYREAEREKAITLLGKLFNDPGGGKFANGIIYTFVLQNPSLNLWEEIRENALA